MSTIVSSETSHGITPQPRGPNEEKQESTHPTNIHDKVLATESSVEKPSRLSESSEKDDIDGANEVRRYSSWSDDEFDEVADGESTRL